MDTARGWLSEVYKITVETIFLETAPAVRVIAETADGPKTLYFPHLKVLFKEKVG